MIMAGSLTSRWICQLLRMRSTGITNGLPVSRRNVMTAHAVPLLNSGYDLKRPDILFGSRSWRWLRPVTPIESELDDYNRYKTRLSFGYLTINADREITECMWRQMLIHLRNKMPNLKMVVLPHNTNNEKWICHIEDMDIFLKMYENTDPLDIMDEAIGDFFDNAPFVNKIIKAKVDNVSSFQEDRESKPYQYYWIFGIHHGLHDGYSNALMSQFGINILNSILARKSIDDSVQLCYATNGDEIIDKKGKLKEALINNPTWLQEEKERLFRTFKTPLLNEAFPAPTVSTPKTSLILRTINPATLNGFYKQCKSAGVSVTNGLIAIINTAIVEMVREAGILRDQYHLSLKTIVDLRRYMPNNPQTATGMLIDALSQSMYPTKNVREEFWKHATIIHKDARALLKTDGVLIQSLIQDMSMPKVDVDLVFNSSKPFIYQYDYTFNNVMDVTPLLYDAKRHKHAVITNANFMPGGIHNFQPMVFYLAGYRGITYFKLAYASNYLSQETAEALMERVTLLIRDKAEIRP